MEKIVTERTLELERKNELMDTSIKVFVGREQRINDFEREIKKLKKN
ncbi:hypothetical protein ACFLZD_02365 [Candidatus Neomarinimicrobiota bacterium]